MKVYLDMVGCRLNQAELETIALDFLQRGFQLTDNPTEADYAVLNTCAVTAAAASDSRGKIRKLKQNPDTKVIVTGCWSDTVSENDELLSGVFQIVPNERKTGLVQRLLGHAESSQKEPITVKVSIPGQRNRTRKFIKAQDGCDNFCTFCLTRLARGKSRSTALETILADVHRAEKAGVKEIILTGVNLGAWGHDFRERLTLVELIKQLLLQSDIPRIRLSSLEPWDLNDDFLNLWENSRLCPHLHLPIQSGSQSVLRRMNRRTDPELLKKQMAAIRSSYPNFSLTTDLICGFPGETEREFEESLNFIKEARFNGGHVFPYSERPQTAAARMTGKVPVKIRRDRAARMRSAIHVAGLAFANQMVRQQVHVLWESAHKTSTQNYQLKGYTENYLPAVKTQASTRVNFIETVVVTGSDQGKLLVEPITD